MFVRTDRLLLRPGWIDDAPALAHALGDAAIARNTARIPWPYTLADAEAFLSRPVAAHAPNVLVFARTSAAPRLIGGVGLECDDDGMELGYWIARPYWGLGFATEAAAALMQAGRQSLRIRRIRSAHFVDNPASGQVLRKLGFRPTGKTVYRHSAARGTNVECVLFSDGNALCEEPAMRCKEAA